MKKLLLSAGCVAALLAVRTTNAAQAGDATKGKDIFEQCGVCHNVDTDEKKIGPSLKGLYKRKLKNGKPATDENILKIINAGGNGMPAYADTLSDDEKKDVMAYLKTV
jgi:mono/diheme cytochrome c family protein